PDAEPKKLKEKLEVLLKPDLELTINFEKQKPKKNMNNEALTTITKAITTLANTLKRYNKNFFFKIEFYCNNEIQNSITWLKKFERATRVNY
ncbi:23530_t:CDS:1, partial [Gigaspora margarita]